ncbi:TetR family transcriptional regulator [Oscillochloris trichoides DG-6]|uniref:TetR family transcriptional regulator n=1 Tax=Oscillochloris trichoides DG-6 TaxID=765420 RepID=E1IEZ6_9CHLR|nr:TetR/AcrR family transcriptional regulator [Oscillochloris trichoides]EFO80241.1 TetR family transcriptional regulator [Oscillochloris trichoides DG-6]
MKEQRRSRQHAAIRDEIKTIARAHMARDGAAALSLRAVASEMGLSSAAIYYYYANRDALITDLIVDAYRSLAAALRHEIEAEPTQDLVAQLRVLMLMYRTWAVAHPSEYALLFGTPIPGYVAPVDITKPEAQAVFAVFAACLSQFFAQGRLDVGLEQSPLPPQIASYAAGLADFPLAVLVGTLRVWAVGHGLVGLELDHHLQPLIGDVAAFYAYEVERLLQSLIKGSTSF